MNGAHDATNPLRRVLMTCDTAGGVWTFALELAAGLSADGIEVVLAALGGTPSREQQTSAARIPNLGLVGSDYKLEWMHDPWPQVAESREWLLGLAREHSPDLVHLNSFGHGGLGFECPVVLTAHSCVMSWWKAVKGTPIPGDWDTYRNLVGCALNSADAITAPSRYMAEALQEHYRFDAKKLRVIYNGRSPARFTRATKEPFVFAAGRLWDDAKNAAALAHIAPSLSWPVVLAGEGDIAGCRGLGKLSSDEIAGWYARAAIYALPARYEPFGLSALEAALSGCALVLGDIPSLREIWGDAALFVSPDDRASLRATIEALIGNQALRVEMSRRSHARALTFDAGAMTQSYLDLYQGVSLGRPLCVS